MILTYERHFYLFSSFFIILPGRHIPPSFYPSELRDIPFDSKEIQKYVGCRLEIELYYSVEGGTWRYLLDSGTAIAPESEAKVKRIYEQSRDKQNVSFGIKLRFRGKILFDGRLFVCTGKNMMTTLLGSWLKLENRGIFAEIGQSYCLKYSSTLNCNYCGRKLVRYGYTIRRLKYLCKADELNANSDEIITTYVRLPRLLCCEKPDASTLDYTCKANKERGNPYNTHVVAPILKVVPFLSYHAILINDAIAASESPDKRQRILSKRLYQGLEEVFTTCIKEHLSTWLKHYEIITAKLKELPLGLALAEHERAKIKEQNHGWTRDGAQRWHKPSKFFALSFVRTYTVLLSRFVLNLSTYYFYPPGARPFKLNSS